MTTIHLSEDLERFLNDAVTSGRYASTDSVIQDALNRLRESIAISGSESETSHASASASDKTLTKHQFQRHLKDIGLLDEAPAAEGSAAGSDQTEADDDSDILSDVVIRERLIEWLTGFLGK